LDGAQVGVIDTATQATGAYYELDGYKDKKVKLPPSSNDWLWLFPNDPVGEQFEVRVGGS